VKEKLIRVPVRILTSLGIREKNDLRRHEVLYIGMKNYLMRPTKHNDYIADSYKAANKLLTHDDTSDSSAFGLHNMVDLPNMNTNLLKIHKCITTYILKEVGSNIANASFKEVLSVSATNDTMVFRVIA